MSVRLRLAFPIAKPTSAPTPAPTAAPTGMVVDLLKQGPMAFLQLPAVAPNPTPPAAPIAAPIKVGLLGEAPAIRYTRWASSRLISTVLPPLASANTDSETLLSFPSTIHTQSLLLSTILALQLARFAECAFGFQMREQKLLQFLRR